MRPPGRIQWNTCSNRLFFHTQRVALSPESRRRGRTTARAFTAKGIVSVAVIVAFVATVGPYEASL